LHPRNTELQQQGLSQLRTMARGGFAAKALAELNRIAADIKCNLDADLQLECEQGLIQVLGNHPLTERRLDGHTHSVRALRFSADGERLYSGGQDNLLKAWSITGPASTVATLKDHSADIRSLAYHGGQSLRLLVSADEKGLIKLWDVKGEAPSCLSTLNADRSAHTDVVRAAALSPDGKRLATAGNDKRIVLWDIADPTDPGKLGELVNGFHQDGIHRLAYIAKGLYKGSLVSADWDGRVGIWQVPDPLDNPDRWPDLSFSATDTEGGPVKIFGLAVSPSGRWIAVGDNRGGVRAWDLERVSDLGNERRFPCFDSHRQIVFDLAFSDDSTTLATVGGDRVLMRWAIPSDPQTAEEFLRKLRFERFEGWGEKLYSVAFRPGYNRSVAVGGAKTIWLADLSRPNALAKPIESTDPAGQDWLAITATSDLRLIAALAGDDKLYLWEWDGDRYQVRPGIADHGKLDHIAIARNGSTLAGLSCTGKLGDLI